MDETNIDNLLKLVDLSDEKCVGEYDSEYGPKRFYPKPEYSIYDYAFLLCLIKGMKNICIIDNDSFFHKDNFKFVNKVIRIANKTDIRCFTETYNNKKSNLLAIYAFKPGYFLDAIFMVFLDYMFRGILDEYAYIKHFNLIDEKMSYRIRNWYNYGKTLGYREKYIKNFYIYFLKISFGIDKDMAIKRYKRDRQIYPILIEKFRNSRVSLKLRKKYKNIKKIPLVKKIFCK